MELLQAGVYPETAYTVVGLFSDPHDVYEKSVKYQGEDFWRKEGVNTDLNVNQQNISDNVNKGNNETKSATSQTLGKNK